MNELDYMSIKLNC